MESIIIVGQDPGFTIAGHKPLAAQIRKQSILLLTSYTKDEEFLSYSGKDQNNPKQIEQGWRNYLSRPKDT